MEKSRQKQIREAVREHYAELAQAQPACCAPESCSGPTEEVVEKIGYSVEDVSSLPQGAEVISLGCGNPLAFSEIREGEVVLDIGSGAGMDAILAARKVGEKGRIIGLDMTPQMIERATKTARAAGVDEIVEFRLGEMEDMPIDDESVDLIISNCVVNLSPDKERVFREAYRVLKPGGRMLVSDLVSSNLPDALRDDLTAWAQCLAGTVEEAEYLRLIGQAGFEDVTVVNRVDATPSLLGTDCCAPSADRSSSTRISSVQVRAVKAVR